MVGTSSYSAMAVCHLYSLDGSCMRWSSQSLPFPNLAADVYNSQAYKKDGFDKESHLFYFCPRAMSEFSFVRSEMAVN